MHVLTAPDEIDEGIHAVTPRISIVIPLYNEEESIPRLYDELTRAIDNCGQSAEVIIIDDGSRDRSFALLSDIAARDPRFTIIRFRRNFGQTAGFAAGFAGKGKCGRQVQTCGIYTHQRWAQYGV